MDEVPDARRFPESTLTAMVQAVDPDWELRDAAPAERGFCTVYRLQVETPTGERECYLKASPDGQPWAIPTEARILSVLDAETTIPVPEVYGVVDDAPDLPSPFYVMEGLPGVEVEYEAVSYVDDEVLRHLATEMGRFLGQLHSVTTLDHFGHVRHRDEGRTGSPPSGDPAVLTVGEPERDWPTFLQAYVDRELDRHEDSHFSERTPALRDWIDTQIGDLAVPFDAVIGRNDHGLHNLLLDADTGDIEGMIDWGYTLAVPAAFDFEFAVYLYSGSFLAGLPDVSDRRPLVRNAMLEGYRDSAPDQTGRVDPPNPLYEVVAMLRIMNDFDHLDVPDAHRTAALDRVRRDVDAILDRSTPTEHR